VADPKALVITGNGTNCEMEMAHACKLGGFTNVDIVYIYEILRGEAQLDDYHLLCLPGGFMDGDDLGAAKASAVLWRHARLRGKKKLAAALQNFIDAGKLIIGVCNGFQLLVKLGLLPAIGGKYFHQTTTLTANDSGRFEDRWVHLKTGYRNPSVFLKGIDRLYLPVRHGEGKLVVNSEETLKQIKKLHLDALLYADYHGEPTSRYPFNPNGSVENIAALTDETGRVLGLMPHPEAFLHYTNFPRWQRFKNMPEEGHGVPLFRNAYNYCRKNL